MEQKKTYPSLHDLCTEQGIDIADIINRRVLVFTGPKGSGKDTACANPLLERARLRRLRFPQERPLFERVPFAGAIKQSCSILYGLTEEEMEDSILKEKTLSRWPWQPPRKLLQDDANAKREQYDGYFHVRAWLRAVAKSRAHCIVVTDLRFPEELQILHEMHNAWIAWVDRREAQRRLEESMKAGDPLSRNVSESHWERIRQGSNFTIDNNGRMEETADYVKKWYCSFWGDAPSWLCDE